MTLSPPTPMNDPIRIADEVTAERDRLRAESEKLKKALTAIQDAASHVHYEFWAIAKEALESTNVKAIQ